MHFSLKVVIKYHFRDDKEKQEELLTMITKALPMVDVDNLNDYQVAIYESNLKLDQSLERVDYLEEKNLQLEDANVQLKNKLSERDEIISRLRSRLSKYEDFPFN